ncbi:MAG: DNA polymerase Y family protein, partial [Pseudomonadota bacterium]
MGRRIIVVALPHLAAEHRLRREGLTGLTRPFALAGQEAGALRVVSLNAAGMEAGLSVGMGLSDARAICPALVTRPAAPERLEAFVGALIRWAARFAPLIGRERDAVTIARGSAPGPAAPTASSSGGGRGRRGDTTGTQAGAAVATATRSRPRGVAKGASGGPMGVSLVLDATGCAHLYGGEAAMLEALLAGLGGLGLTARAAMADTKGAAWALAEYGGARLAIAPPGRSRAAIADLPAAALRLDPAVAEGLAGVGLASIGEMAGVARAQIARRFGVRTVQRLDQALGQEPEPVAPARRIRPVAARLTLAEPIGLTRDVMAGLDRLLEVVAARLAEKGLGARCLRLTARRVDGADVSAEIRLARPMRDPMRLRALMEPKIDDLDAGWGIDALRLAAPETEPMRPSQVRTVDTGRSGNPATTEADALADLMSRIGNRIGFESVTRLLPAESHIPERAFTEAAAAWSERGDWHRAMVPGAPARPLTLFPPEPIAPTGPEPRDRAAAGSLRPPPRRFRWRAQTLSLAAVAGPERLAPEWWWDDPAW